MRKLILCAVVSLMCSAIAVGQTAQRFPGLSPMHVQMLESAREITPIPLPTWLPAGFRVEKVNLKLGTTVSLEDRVLAIMYSRKLPNGKTQRFSIEAGFQGLGDLPYDTTSTVESAVGKIEIAYQPPDLDNKSRKLTDLSMTQWFEVGETAFHFDGMYGAKPADRSLVMIPLAETKRILQSLEKF